MLFVTEGSFILILPGIRSRMPDDFITDYDFGKYLRANRKRNRLSFSELAAMTDISRQRIASLESGYPEKGVTRKECIVLASYLNVPVKDFIRKAVGI